MIRLMWQTINLLMIVLLLPGLTLADQAAEPIKIGALYNLTGSMAAIDRPALNGARLKVKQINQAGGLLGGRQLELISLDTKTDEQAAGQAAKKLLAMGVAAGLGYGDTNFVLAVAPTFQAAGVPFVTSGATHPELPEWIGNCMFMVPFGDDDQAFAIAEFAYHKLKIRNVAIWTDICTDFTLALARFFKQRFTELGGDIVEEGLLKTGDQSFGSLINKLQSASPKPEAIFIAALPVEAGRAIKQIRQTGLTLPILGGDSFDNQLIINTPGIDGADQVYFSTHSYRGDARPAVSQFMESFQQEYGQIPDDAFAALGFDAVGLIAEAITRAGTTEEQALSQALRTTKDFQGITGNISYIRANGVPIKPVAIVGVSQGRFELLDTWKTSDKIDIRS
ncbi:MAG: ABC transporter substrate-binding protein [Desulfobacca sp.]|nr:ABC transporter substrate-binding protein [Desulfobacca sp.]